MWRPPSLLLLGAAALLVAVAAACGSPPSDDAHEEPGDAVLSGAKLEEPRPRPDVTLLDQNGSPYDFRTETEGWLTLLFFGYTHCPDVCPVHMANLGEVIRDLPREITGGIQVVFVTADPDRDTPERLREWLGSMHPSFVGLWGSREEVNDMERSLGLPPSSVDPAAEGEEPFVAHAAQVLVFDPSGPARIAYPWGTRQRDWLRDLPRLVRAGGAEPFIDDLPAARD